MTTGPTEVPCNGCTECCKSNQALLLHPEQGDNPQAYRFETVTDRATGQTFYALARDEKGRCVYLDDSGCTIYDRRPVLCRSFDCRKHYLILPKQDRDNLVKLGLSSRAVFTAGRLRIQTLSLAERKECLDTQKEFFSQEG